MATDFPGREVSSLVQLFQRAHNKVVALQKLDDQIALLVEKHRGLQDEVRAIRDEINVEFDKALRHNDTPGKLASDRAPAEAPAADGDEDPTEEAEPDRDGDDPRLVVRAS